MSEAHWLLRLDEAAWLRAAETELAAGAANVGLRRTAVTHARRAAGMAANAVLRALEDGDTRWGRSYLEHLQALARDASPLPAEVQAAARTLLAISPVAAPGLVTLARGPHAAADEALAAARVIVDACAQRRSDDEHGG